MIMLQNYIMITYGCVLINSWLFQIIKKSKLGNKHDLVHLFLVDIHDYDNWYENEELVDTKRKSDKEESVHLTDIPPLGGDKEEGKGLKILTTSKFLTRLKVLIAQIKVKYEIGQILYPFYQHNKILKKFATI